ncbi:hypothetical protein ACFQU1_08335 [Chelatococcus sp. GCM10030263]|uniref:ABC transporter ATP-binding protein n=1 Tax=Chelatococcus sp. GCM10030263 TaxID=3273387 RepID=UPI0036074B80
MHRGPNHGDVAGQVCETSNKRAIFTRPLQPYTQALLASVPQHGRGCRFAGRCIASSVAAPECYPWTGPTADRPSTGMGRTVVRTGQASLAAARRPCAGWFVTILDY